MLIRIIRGKRAEFNDGRNINDFYVNDANLVDDLWSQLCGSMYLLNKSKIIKGYVGLSADDFIIVAEWQNISDDNVVSMLNDLKKKDFIGGYEFIYNIKF